MKESEYRAMVFKFCDDMIAEEGNVIMEFAKICPIVKLTYGRGSYQSWPPIIPCEAAIPHFFRLIDEYNKSKGNVMIFYNSKQIYKIDEKNLVDLIIKPI